MNTPIKAVVDELFNQLETKFAQKPLILFVVHVLHVAALDLVPAIAAKVTPPPVTRT
jgi:hypothetical protein